ncbi:MAG TPA: polysaccharide biosynthesis tyrosine autokinase [Gemmatimonadaceae bacterium]|nr:polysaccharide biosynthesis tyrosine autokinase [Gemmatimonadaceae bacterium]
MTLAPLDLRQILAILRRRIWWILAFASLGAGGAGYMALKSKPIYQATGTIRLTENRQRLTSGLTGQTDTRPLLTADPLLSQIAILTSRAVVGGVVDSMPELRVRTTDFPERLVTDFSIPGSPDETASLGTTITLTFGQHEVTAVAKGGERATAAYGEPLDLAGVHFAISARPSSGSGTLKVLHRVDAVERLAKSIQAKPREETNVIDVSFNSTDPDLAQNIINTLVQTFKQSSIEDAAQEARLRRQFIETQLKENDSLLSDARLAVSKFRSQQKSFSAREKFTVERSDLAGIQQQQSELDSQRRLYASIAEELKNGNRKGSLQELGALLSAQGANASPVVMDLYQQIQRLQGTRDSLTTGQWARSSSNPDVQRIDALIASASDRLERTVTTIVGVLDDRRASLSKMQAQNTATLVQIPATDAEEAVLLEREESYRKIADQLRDEYQKARLAEAAEVGQIDIVDLATLPKSPVGVPASRKVVFGILLGLFAGVGVALVLEHLNTSIRGREDVEVSLRLPGLAVIPKFDHGIGLARLKKVTTVAQKGHGTLRMPGRLASGSQVSGALVTVNDVHSPGAEAYRTLRTKLLFSRAAGELKTIVVTSPFTQDGKSTTAANLATTFAQHGMRTLLVDCDLRRPTQHEIFRVPREPGLTELLSGDGIVAGTGRRTNIEGLSLITAGALPPDPSELVGSSRMRNLLARFAESFDVIVVDSPPVLPVADAAILATMADGALLVVRAGATNRKAAQLAVQQLEDVDARVLGVVLNDPKAQVPLYDQYGYASYYSYGSKG